MFISLYKTYALPVRARLYGTAEWDVYCITLTLEELGKFPVKGSYYEISSYLEPMVERQTGNKVLPGVECNINFVQEMKDGISIHDQIAANPFLVLNNNLIPDSTGYNLCKT